MPKARPTFLCRNDRAPSDLSHPSPSVHPMCRERISATPNGDNRRARADTAPTCAPPRTSAWSVQTFCRAAHRPVKSLATPRSCTEARSGTWRQGAVNVRCGESYVVTSRLSCVFRLTRRNVQHGDECTDPRTRQVIGWPPGPRSPSPWARVCRVREGAHLSAVRRRRMPREPGVDWGKFGPLGRSGPHFSPFSSIHPPRD